MKADTSTTEVRKMWECVRIDLEESGADTRSPFFIQDVTSEVRRRLGIAENYIALDKFKKFL